MESLAPVVNGALFAVAAAAIWWAGTRLEQLADVISRRTGLGDAFTGMLLLATVTSLPEVATTVTAIVVLHDPELAVHNLLGGVAMQTALLIVADRCGRRRGALTFFTPRYVLLLQGLGLVVILLIAIAAVATQGVPVMLSVSGWSLLLLLAFVGLLRVVHRRRGQPRWTPTPLDDVPLEMQEDLEEQAKTTATTPGGDAGPDDERSLRKVTVLFTAMAAVVVVGGWIATETAEALANQSGLGSAFIGATLLATATSLPELSTTVSASRHGRYTVAVSNVFGSNAFDVGLLVLADVLYRGGSVFAHAGGTVVFVATIGAGMTCVYVWGLIERANRTIFGIGYDSAAALLVYVAGMAVLYWIG